MNGRSRRPVPTATRLVALENMKSAVEVLRPEAAVRLANVRAELEIQGQRFAEVRSQLQVTIEGMRRDRPQYDRLRESAFARLQARLESMPVIEQAKGILMAQSNCGPDEAFEMLRRASQRMNVKVSVLAARIVQGVAEGKAIGGGGG